MGGGVGGGGGHFYGGIGARARAFAHHGDVNGFSPDWREQTLKTLEQELKDRGIEPRSGDDLMQVVPTPRIIGDRVSLFMVCAVVTLLGLMACWAWWEYLPD